MFSQGGELAHVGEGILRQEADLIVAQISAENKGQKVKKLLTTGKQTLVQQRSLVDSVLITAKH